MNIRAEQFSPRSEKGRYPKWSRPNSYWDVIVVHLPFAFAAGLLLLVPVWVNLQSLSLIKCTFLSFTGLPCPFCGFTRSLWAISAGDWHFALNHCPLSLGLYTLVALSFVWHSAALIMGIKLSSGFHRLLKWNFLWWIVAVLFLLNWIYRIACGLA